MKIITTDNFLSTLDLEEYIRQLRLAYSIEHFIDRKNANFYTEEDIIAIYTCRNIQEQERKKRLTND